jgi:hypothetical protein
MNDSDNDNDDDGFEVGFKDNVIQKTLEHAVNTHRYKGLFFV